MDHGAAVGADGKTQPGKGGALLQYVVAAGDTEQGICKRFTIDWWQLQTASGSYLGTYPVLQTGETLNIVPASETDAEAAGADSSNSVC